MRVSFEAFEFVLKGVDPLSNLLVLKEDDLPELQDKVFGHVVEDRSHFVKQGLC